MNSKQTNTKYEGAKRSGFAPAFHTMTGKFSASLFLAVCTLFPQAIVAQASDPQSPAGEIRGAVTRINVQGDATALEGILVNLSAGSAETGPVNPKRRRWSFPIRRIERGHLSAGREPDRIQALYRDNRPATEGIARSRHPPRAGDGGLQYRCSRRGVRNHGA